MDFLGNEFLAGAGFTTDQDGAVSWGDLLDLLEDVLNGVAVAEDLTVRLRSVMSRTRATKQRWPPSWMAERVTSTGKEVPSLRR